MMESQLNLLPNGNSQGMSNNGQSENAAVYCRCRGEIVSELFVKCDGDQECINGSWLHPQCTTDLCVKTKAELDALEEWYCEDCVARIKREDAPEEIGDIELDEEVDEIVIDEEDQVMDIDYLNQEIKELEMLAEEESGVF